MTSLGDSYFSASEKSGKRQHLAVRYARLDEIKPDPRNPRRHEKRQIKTLRKSIETFGFVVPILIDKNSKIIAGHGRLMAAREAAFEEVPVIQLDHLTEAQARAFMIADNRLTEISEWDDRLLAEQLKSPSELHLDFDLEVTGFETTEIDLRIEGLSAPDEKDRADDVPSATGCPCRKPN